MLKSFMCKFPRSEVEKKKKKKKVEKKGQKKKKISSNQFDFKSDYC